MTLKEIIFDQIADIEAKDMGFHSWDQFNTEGDIDRFMVAKLSVLQRTIDRLDSVMRWANLNGWVYRLQISAEEYWRDRVWMHSEKYKKDMRYGLITDAELLQLYKEKNP